MFQAIEKISLCDGPTTERTNEQTDQPTDQPTDRPADPLPGVGSRDAKKVLMLKTCGTILLNPPYFFFLSYIGNGIKYEKCTI